MLHSGRLYQTVSEMSAEVTVLLKAWMEESYRQEQRCKEEQQHYEQERLQTSQENRAVVLNIL